MTDLLSLHGRTRQSKRGMMCSKRWQFNKLIGARPWSRLNGPTSLKYRICSGSCMTALLQKVS